MGLMWQSEVLEQPAERSLNFSEREVLSAFGEASEGKEQQEGLVRGTLVAAPPHVEGGHAGS